MRRFLKQHGYRMGYVTIDASDWYVDERLRARLAQNPEADLTGYKNFYLDHLWERAVYYDDLSRKVLGRSVKHTLLIHHNVLNELFLKDVLEMFQSKGWKLINARALLRIRPFPLRELLLRRKHRLGFSKRVRQVHAICVIRARRRVRKTEDG